MPHNSHTTSSRNQDLEHAYRSRDAYLALAADWEDPFPEPVIEGHENRFVVREDLLAVGSKARFGSLLVQTSPKRRPLVYVAPRFGYAGISLAWLCREYGRRLVLFMPACKRISAHQAVAIEMGAIPVFYRIAAMPNLNARAERWAAENNGVFVPLGLKHPLVTACIVKTAWRITEKWIADEVRSRKVKSATIDPRLFQPMEVWTAMSTGVLSRGLQIAWPDSKFYGVAVARNIHDGERGEAEILSHHREFAQDVEPRHAPPFPCASNYDAKAWEYMDENGSHGALFWNVAGNISPKSVRTFEQKSDVRWGEEPRLRL